MQDTQKRPGKKYGVFRPPPECANLPKSHTQLSESPEHVLWVFMETSLCFLVAGKPGTGIHWVSF